MNRDKARRMISDHQIFSFFRNIRGTSHYFHNMLLDVLAKIRQFGLYTFLLTASTIEFHWNEILQVTAEQYGRTLTDEEVNAVDLRKKVNYLNRNTFFVAKQTDCVFK